MEVFGDEEEVRVEEVGGVVEVGGEGPVAGDISLMDPATVAAIHNTITNSITSNTTTSNSTTSNRTRWPLRIHPTQPGLHQPKTPAKERRRQKLETMSNLVPNTGRWLLYPVLVLVSLEAVNIQIY